MFDQDAKSSFKQAYMLSEEANEYIKKVIPIDCQVNPYQFIHSGYLSPHTLMQNAIAQKVNNLTNLIKFHNNRQLKVMGIDKLEEKMLNKSNQWNNKISKIRSKSMPKSAMNKIISPLNFIRVQTTKALSPLKMQNYSNIKSFNTLSPQKEAHSHSNSLYRIHNLVQHNYTNSNIKDKHISQIDDYTDENKTILRNEKSADNKALFSLHQNKRREKADAIVKLRNSKCMVFTSQTLY